MKRLNPEKLSVTYLPGVLPERLTLPRRYTLTHSDRTGELFLSIGSDYDEKRVSGLYIRLMRDEVFAEFIDDGGRILLKVYCHVSGGFALGTAKWRYNIFQSELTLVLESFRYGDRALYESNPQLDNAPVHVKFSSKKRRYDKIEDWGIIGDYK